VHVSSIVPVNSPCQMVITLFSFPTFLKTPYRINCKPGPYSMVAYCRIHHATKPYPTTFFTTHNHHQCHESNNRLQTSRCTILRASGMRENITYTHTSIVIGYQCGVFEGTGYRVHVHGRNRVSPQNTLS
jgi:hypothetical protein